jgi:hypothetical protein
MRRSDLHEKKIEAVLVLEVCEAVCGFGGILRNSSWWMGGFLLGWGFCRWRLELLEWRLMGIGGSSVRKVAK